MDFEAVNQNLTKKMRELVNLAKSHYFSSVPSTTKKSIDELRKQLPIQGNDFNNLETAIENFKLPIDMPLIVKRKSHIRDAQSMKQYYDLAEEILTDTNKQTPKDIFKLIARCLILANAHHYITTCTQPEASASSFLSYILEIKMQRQKDSYPLLYNYISNYPKLKTEMAFLYVTPIREGFPKRRTKQNRINNDSIEDNHIQELIKTKNLKVVFVTINEQNFNSRADCTAQFINKPQEIISSDCIVVDQSSRRILAILISGELYHSDANIPHKMRETINKINPHSWTYNHRVKTEASINQEDTSPAQTGAIQLGIFNAKYRNAYSKGSHDSKDALQQVKIVSQLATAAFEKWLPKTFHSAMASTESLRDSIPFLSGPFASATINKRVSMKPHRDENAHSFSCMAVYEIDESKKTSTGTCFPEWIINTDGQEKMATFVVKTADLFIADFDYIHFIPKTSEKVQRYSLLMYTYDQVVVPPILECEDSDIEESDYVASTIGNSQAAAAASSSSLQRSIKPTQQIKPLPLATYVAAQAHALASYSPPLVLSEIKLGALPQLHFYLEKITMKKLKR